jgi:hypothetical protein
VRAATFTPPELARDLVRAVTAIVFAVGLAVPAILIVQVRGVLRIVRLAAVLRRLADGERQTPCPASIAGMNAGHGSGRTGLAGTACHRIARMVPGDRSGRPSDSSDATAASLVLGAVPMRILALLTLVIGSAGPTQAQETDLDWRSPGLVCLIDAPNPHAGLSSSPAGPSPDDGLPFPSCMTRATTLIWPAFRFSGGPRF